MTVPTLADCLSSINVLSGHIGHRRKRRERGGITGRATILACLASGLLFASPGLADTRSSEGANSLPDAPFTHQDGFRTIPIITNRSKHRNRSVSNRFGGDRSKIRHGSCSVSRTKIPGLQPLADTVSFHVPQSIDILEEIEEIEAETFWRELQKATGDRRPTLYVHGYRVDFAKACRRAARLQDNLDMAGSLAVFSWPSEGTALGYSKDEANVMWSVPHLRETIERMAKTFGPGGFNLVAHSLGSRGVIDALLQTDQASGDQVLINRLIFIAPDVDAGIFVQKSDKVTTLARKTTLYASKFDSPLALSSEVHGYPRLGQAGPHLKGLKNIETIDVSGLHMSTPTGHVYHLFNPAVIDSLRKRLATD